MAVNTYIKILRAPTRMYRKPCHRWNSAGTCPKGDKCIYSHDYRVIILAREEAEAEQQRILQLAEEAAQRALIVEQEAARKARIAEQEAAQKALMAEQAAARKAEQKAARSARIVEQEAARRALIAKQEAAQKARIAEQEAAQQARIAQQEARRLEIAKEEAAMIFQHVVLDFALVTFSAGLTIQNILTGFESCRVRIKNLPLDATHSEVCALFAQQSADAGQFHVVGMKVVNGKQEADVICHHDLKVIAIGLDGIDFKQERLEFEVCQNGSIAGGGMRASAGSRSDILTISWRAPSVCFVVTYVDKPQAEAKVRELDRKICAGRRVKVEMNRQPAGQAFRHFSANAVTIRGLPPSVTDTVVAQFSGSTLIRRLKSADYDAERAHEYLRFQVGAAAQLFETVDTDAVEGIFTARVHFDSWTQAKKVYDSLDKQPFWFIGNTSFWLRLPDPLQYTITIPTQQYHAQRKRWNLLQADTKEKEGCHLSANAKDKVYVIRVGGDDKKAIGSLKVRVENLAAGEKLERWHGSLGAGVGGQRFLDSVFETTGACIRNDRRLRAVTAYGEPRNIEAARNMVETEVERLESLEQTVFLKRQSVRFFVRRGLAALEEELGKDNVTLNISSSPCKITIKGGEIARHALSRLIDESLDHTEIVNETEPDSKCPICYDEITSPVQLACGHNYCTACIRHFLTTASDSKIFPLCCMGDENNCRAPIPIPVLQRFLPPQQFKHLLETVFFSHIEHLPQEFKYCTTPDCRQVYRCVKSQTSLVLYCPSCLSAICTSCHEEAHEGMSCAERKLHNDPAEQERLNDQLAIQSGFKRCPECTVWIEKNEGCNHMSCKCGAHICWVCMKVFTHGTDIYDHMHAAHGGIYGGVEAQNNAGAWIELPEEAVDDDEYALQVELLRQAAQLRGRRQEHLQREDRHWERQRGIQEDLGRQDVARRQEEMQRRAEIRRQDVARRLTEMQRQAEIRRQEIRQIQIQRQEAETQRDSGWGCAIM
ncbi:hypothetical protein PILCRDRAFT_96062 [Piloderma croceum F 1598]|uniref:RBR-type E3 ubiquitin transferase n=1 Tax=Piloderma croceum (strain F 1598) TaxID=765440 RepID=A0A0C3G4B9_PILCF|nr:hypothetical protein PILCRDRAFT_96062 [Piloderma croceum F 1598]